MCPELGELKAGPEAEHGELRGEFDSYRLYPVLSLSVSYRLRMCLKQVAQTRMPLASRLRKPPEIELSLPRRPGEILDSSGPLSMRTRLRKGQRLPLPISKLETEPLMLAKSVTEPKRAVKSAAAPKVSIPSASAYTPVALPAYLPPEAGDFSTDGAVLTCIGNRVLQKMRPRISRREILGAPLGGAEINRQEQQALAAAALYYSVWAGQ